MAIRSVYIKYMQVIFLHIVLPSSTTDIYPPSWTNVCEIEDKSTHNQVILKCFLSGNDHVAFKLKDLNNYNQNVSIGVDVMCGNGGNLSMSLPMKIENLVDLRVEGCNIYDYINDFDNPRIDDIKDTLVYLHVIDSTIFYDIAWLFDALENNKNITKAWKCGNDDTLREMIYRNIAFQIEFNTANMDYVDTSVPSVQNNQAKTPAMYPDIINIPKQFQYDFIKENILDQSGPGCDFLKLELLEETGFDDMSRYDMQILSKGSSYPNLKILNYSNNGIKELDLDEYYYKLKELHYIDYSFNIIREIRLNVFRGSHADRDIMLDVRYNNITKLTVEDLINWSNLDNVVINIRGNPLDCECFKQDFILKIQDEGFFMGDLLKYKYIRNMTCASPESARGVTLASITKVEMGCSVIPIDMNAYLIVLGVSAVIVICIIVLVFRFRKEIKIILYIKLNILLPWDKDEKNETKKYDAFFSYSSEDGDFVCNKLAKELENPSDNSTALKLCLHEREFIGGKTILDNIIYSIENSRHTVILLSNNFLNSVWSMAEFKTAYEESITKKHRHLIIIKYETIAESDLDPLMKRCLRTYTYLDINDRMYLDRLRYALAVKHKPVKKKEESIDTIAKTV